IPTPLLKDQSPYFLRFNQQPDLHDLKVFGSLCYASTTQNHRTKLDPRARKAVYLGYKQGVKGAVLFDLNTKNIFISRNVTFHEHIFPYQTTHSKIPWEYHSNHVTSSAEAPVAPIIDDDLHILPLAHDFSASTPESIVPPSPSPQIDLPRTITDLDTVHPNLRKSTTTIHKPTHLSDYICNLSTDSVQSTSTANLLCLL
ncbi:retrovirus-related pol polyprotein from transposon TNT 1-94, partial [Trifolium medium]|nr:retrovirus-related pol polyprotein from transposon TNT 1-94 [Trifolium medium]